MMNAAEIRRQVKRLLLVLTGMVCTALCANAGQESYDINLKELKQQSYDINLRELRRTPARRARTRRHARSPKRALPAASAPTATADGNSSYTVRSGDHIFLILSRHYGLSNTATERMIPRVMQLNNIRTPYRLTVGQQLLIPLPPPGATTAQGGEQKPSPPPPARVEVPAVKQETPPAKPEVPAVTPEATPVRPEPPPVKPEASPVRPEASPVRPEAPPAIPPAPRVERPTPPVEFPATPKRP